MGEYLDLLLENPAHGGACVARAEKMVVFVRHGLPGERIRAEITRKRSKLAWADAIKMYEASADRVPSIWPEAGPGGIGGGELGHVALDAQLVWKTTVLTTTIRRIGGEGLTEAFLPLDPVQVAEVPGYPTGLGTRTRTEFVVSPEGNAAMHRFHSNELQEITQLPLMDSDITRLRLLDPGYWKKIWRPGSRVRAVVTPGDEPLILIDGVAYGADQKPTSREKIRYYVPDIGEFQVSANGFFQVHKAAPQIISEAVLAAAELQEGQTCLELYSGSGLLTRSLGQAVGQSGGVVSLEGEDTAVEDARANIPEDLPVRLFAGSVSAEAISALGGADGPWGQVDVVVADPPRAGAGKELVTAMALVAKKRIVLVSCDPATFARDARVLVEADWRPIYLKAWDLFPHTHHMEIIAAFDRN